MNQNRSRRSLAHPFVQSSRIELCKCIGRHCKERLKIPSALFTLGDMLCLISPQTLLMIFSVCRTYADSFLSCKHSFQSRIDAVVEKLAQGTHHDIVARDETISELEVETSPWFHLAHISSPSEKGLFALTSSG